MNPQVFEGIQAGRSHRFFKERGLGVLPPASAKDWLMGSTCQGQIALSPGSWAEGRLLRGGLPGPGVRGSPAGTGPVSLVQLLCPRKHLHCAQGHAGVPPKLPTFALSRSSFETRISHVFGALFKSPGRSQGTAQRLRAVARCGVLLAPHVRRLPRPLQPWLLLSQLRRVPVTLPDRIYL